MGWIIVFVFSMLMTVGGILAAVEEKTVVLFVLLAIYVILDIISWKKYQNTENVRTKKEAAAKTIFRAWTEGFLPIAHYGKCTISSESDCYKISGGGNVFELKKDKIINIAVQKDFKTQKRYVSSRVRSVAGGMAFGLPGAIIGALPNEKTYTIVTKFLIYTYYSDDKIKYAAFSIKDRHDLRIARKWEREFRKKNGSAQ